VRPAYEGEGRWRERIRASLVALLSFLEDEPYMGKLLIVEALGAGERALEQRRRVLDRLLAAVDEGRGEAKSATGPPPLTAEGVVGGVLKVLHGRLMEADGTPTLLEFTGQLTSMIVLPYLGVAAAQRELARPLPTHEDRRERAPANPLADLEMRLTYRTVRVLLGVARHPGASNRELAIAAEVSDQGQMSKLLMRLEKLGLLENTGAGHARGGPNAWMLTGRGRQVAQTIDQQTAVAQAAA
jgi:DNA-binding MarR family transcriptional regulator